MKKRKIWIDPFLFLVVFINMAIHHIWFFSTSILTFEDAGYNFTEQLRQITSFRVWDLSGLGSITTMPSAYPYLYSAGLLARAGLPTSIIQRIIFFWPMIIAGSIGGYLLVKKVSGNSLGGFVGSIVINLNTYFIVSSSNHITIATAIAWFPLTFYLFILLTEKPSPWRALACSVPLFVIGFLEFRIFYVCCFPLLLYYFFSFQAGKEKKGILLFTLLYFSPIVIVALLNAYWIIPYFWGGLKGGLEGVTVGRPIFIGGTIGTNPLLNSLTLFHPMWSGGELVTFSVHQIPYYWFFLPLIAFSALIFNKLRRNGTVLCFSLIALVGIFLCKFYFPPFPGAYEWLYRNFPLFNAYREPSKFTFLIYISYSVLIGCLIGQLLIMARGDTWKKAITFMLAVLIAIPFLFNAVPVVTGSAGALFIPRSVPDEYNIIKTFIMEQPDFCRTLWVPTYSRWSYYDDAHPRVSCVSALSEDWIKALDKDHEDTFKPENIMYALERPFSHELLRSSSIGYVIVPAQPAQKDDDFYVYYGGNRQFFIDRLDKLDYLERIDIGTKETVVYRLKDFRPGVYATCDFCCLDPNGDINTQYMLVKNKFGKDFPFALSDNLTDYSGCIQVSDVLASQGEPGEIVADSTALAIPALSEGENLSLYIDEAKGELTCSFEEGYFILRNIAPGVLTDGGKPIYGFPNKGDVLWTKKINQNFDYWLEANDVRIKLEQSKTTSLGETSRIKSLKLYQVDRQNVIPNGSFESGAWKDKVEDYCNDDREGLLGMKLTSEEITQGKYSLQLETIGHIAGTHTDFPVVGGQEYYFDFDYHSPNLGDAGYDLEFRDRSGAVMLGAGIGERLSIPNEVWHHYSKIIIPPNGAVAATLFIYSYDKDGQTKMITRYDNFELKSRNLIDDIDIGKYNNRLTEVKTDVSGENHQLKFEPLKKANKNLIYNASFEDGLWGDEVVNCSRDGSDPEFGMRLNESAASDGRFSLQIETARNIAGTYTVFPVEGNLDYIFSFDYQSPNSALASYYLEFNDVNHTTISEVLQTAGTKWQKFQRKVTTPIGATLAILYVYANPNFDEKTMMINRYDNFRFSQVAAGPGLFYAVKTPHEKKSKQLKMEVVESDPLKKTIDIESGMDPFILVFNQKYDRGWQLTVNNERVVYGLTGSLITPEPTGERKTKGVDMHFPSNYSLNAWYIDPQELLSEGLQGEENADKKVNLELILEFAPQRSAEVGKVLTLLTILGIIALILGKLFWLIKSRIIRGT
jgi:hypothetical protein